MTRSALRRFRVGILAAFLPTAAALAITINVNSTADVLADDGFCTLREAVIAANTDFPSGVLAGECPPGAGADLIMLGVPGPYLLTRAGTDEDAGSTGDLDLTESVEIHGTSATLHVINAQFLDRVFHIQGSTTTVMLKNITLRGGRAASSPGNDGGAIWKQGNLTISDSVIISNSAMDDGGAIFNSRDILTLTRTTLKDNQATFRGGGVYGLSAGDSAITINHSIFDSNTAGDDGGGIFGFDPIVINSTVFMGNMATDKGGGIYNVDNADIFDSTFTMNGANQGAAVFSQDPLTVHNSTFSKNTAVAAGGGLYQFGSTATLRNVTLYEGNTLPSSAIFNGGATVTVVNTLIAGRCDGTATKLTSSGGNIESPGNTCDLGDPTDQTAVSAVALNLLVLAENGAPGPTHLPGVGSAALESGFLGLCLGDDQRGVIRPKDFDGVGGAQCDVGAIELEPCPHIQVLQLQNDTLSGTMEFKACERIEVGPALEIAAPGQVTLRTGSEVVVGDGFSILDNADVVFDTDWAFWENLP